MFIDTVCTECCDRSRRVTDESGHCEYSICAVCGGTVRPATPQELCDACNNPHRSDFAHSCSK